MFKAGKYWVYKGLPRGILWISRHVHPLILEGLWNTKYTKNTYISTEILPDFIYIQQKHYWLNIYSIKIKSNSLSDSRTLRWIPMCQVFSHFSDFFTSFCIGQISHRQQKPQILPHSCHHPDREICIQSCFLPVSGLPWWPCGLRHCHWLLAVSHHCLGSNPGRGMRESCQWLGVRQWFSLRTLVSSTRYNWLIMT